MKITQLFKIYWPDNGGGIAKVMESIADGLQDCEQEIIVCQDSRSKKNAKDRYRGVLVRRCRQIFEVCSTPISTQFLYEIKKCTRKSDIVIYHFPYPMVDLAVLFGMYSGRLVVWWHCGFEKYKMLAFFYRPLVKHTLSKADLILVSAKGNLENEDILLPYKKKCRVIPFCVSEECYQRGKAYANRSYEQNGQDDVSRVGQQSQIHILFVGRLVWYKGCDVLLKAFAKMRYKNCRLIVVGSGPLEQELKKLATSLKIENVVFTGMVSEEEKMKWLEKCDFLVLPSVSKAEAFAVVQLEAMAFGKPVINTALPSGVPDVSIHGVTGITVEPGNVKQLACAMKKLADSNRLRKKYGENALQKVNQQYTKSVMMQKYHRLFWKMIEESSEITNRKQGRKMKKLAIISSWKEPCGIASYVSYLLPEFQKYFKTDILPLKTEILQNTGSNISKMGDQLIDQIASRVSEYDYVNIHFEVGLFGVSRSQVYRRLMKIVKAAKNVIVTFHSINLKGADFHIKNFVCKNPVGELIALEKNNYWPDFYKNVFQEFSKLSKKKNIHVIVHNRRDRDAIRRITGFKNVHDYPLAMYNAQIRNKVKTEEQRYEFKKKYGLASDDIVLGVFGFVSMYKGHETVIQALSYLPDNYRMIIFGGQHIRGIQPFIPVDKYLSQLLDLIIQKDEKNTKGQDMKKLLRQKIIFAGGVTDEDFMEAMEYSDFVILPYMEVNQMASGVATNALECRAKIIMSNTNCFHELNRYFPNCFKRFDIGNYLELVNCIERWEDKYDENIKKCLKKYNVENNVKNYVAIFEGRCNEK